MIESPMLLLREGHRDIHITFGLEEDSISYFKELIATTEQSSHETGRVLNDAFLLELSTEKGWAPIYAYTLTFINENSFYLKFVLNEKFDPTTCLLYTSGLVCLYSGSCLSSFMLSSFL